MHDKILKGLNQAQLHAVTYDKGHALVLAGAGCGKTKTIVARCGHLLGLGIAANRIQVLTFTNKSAKEIVHRVSDVIGPEAENLSASTFHTWAMGLIRRAPTLFGFKSASIIDQDDQTTLFKMIRAKHFNPAMKAKLGYEIPKPAGLASAHSYWVNTGLEFGQLIAKFFPELKNYPEAFSTIKEIFREYREAKVERNMLDYDDLLLTLAKKMSEDQEAFNYVARQADHILVDECQDTNPLQWMILRPLQKTAVLFCVGDDAQSIYAFRGADFESIHRFTDIIENSTVLRLEENYRCLQPILDISNWLINESPLPYNRKLKAFRGDGDLPVVHTFADQHDEAKWVCDDIISKCKQGHKPSSNMVIVRGSFAARRVESEFIKRKVPYKFTGGSRLLESSHVRDVLAVFRVLFNYKDDLAWMRFLSLYRGVGDKAASTMAQVISSCESANEAFKMFAQLPKVPQSALETIYAVSKANTIEGFVKAAVTALTPQLAATYKDDWDRRKYDFYTLADLAKDYDSLDLFIEHCVLDPAAMQEKANNGATDMVSVITVHSSKGMEAPHVYLLNVSEGVYPSAKSSSDKEIEEERRVLYVSMTRAINELHVCRHGSTSKDSKGRIEYQGTCEDGYVASKYLLHDMPEDFYSHVDHNKPKTDFGWTKDAYADMSSYFD